MKKQHCKVYYSLLAICYLEVRVWTAGAFPLRRVFGGVSEAMGCNMQVLLWTTCLLSSCATTSAVRAEDAGYLLRETVSFPPLGLGVDEEICTRLALPFLILAL